MCGKLGPGKRPYYKAFRGRFRGRPYVSMACPVLPKCFPHLKPSLLDILPRSGPIPERRYNGQKSRLFHSESCYAGKWPGLCPGASSHSPIPLCNGNVKKCAVGKHPKSEKHGNTAQFSEVERSGTQENCGGIGSGCRLCLRPLPVLRRRQSQRVARIDPNAVVVDKNIAENDRFDLFSR